MISEIGIANADLESFRFLMRTKERIEYWIESPPKLWEARSRLYRSQILQVNTHFAAFFEIYKIDILLHRSKLNFFVKNRQQFCEIEYWIEPLFNQFFHQNCYFSAKFWWNFVGISRMCSKIVEVDDMFGNFAKFWEISAKFPRNCAKIQYYSIFFNRVLKSHQIESVL